jgi:hypothetical protein
MSNPTFFADFVCDRPRFILIEIPPVFCEENEWFIENELVDIALKSIRAVVGNIAFNVVPFLSVERNSQAVKYVTAIPDLC